MTKRSLTPERYGSGKRVLVQHIPLPPRIFSIRARIWQAISAHRQLFRRYPIGRVAPFSEVQKANGEIGMAMHQASKAIRLSGPREFQDQRITETIKRARLIARLLRRKKAG